MGGLEERTSERTSRRIRARGESAYQSINYGGGGEGGRQEGADTALPPSAASARFRFFGRPNVENIVAPAVCVRTAPWHARWVGVMPASICSASAELPPSSRPRPTPPAHQDHRPHLISTSPRLPVNCPSMYSSVLASCRFMYESTDTR